MTHAAYVYDIEHVIVDNLQFMTSYVRYNIMWNVSLENVGQLTSFILSPHSKKNFIFYTLRSCFFCNFLSAVGTIDFLPRIMLFLHWGILRAPKTCMLRWSFTQERFVNVHIWISMSVCHVRICMSADIPHTFQLWFYRFVFAKILEIVRIFVVCWQRYCGKLRIGERYSEIRAVP